MSTRDALRSALDSLGQNNKLARVEVSEIGQAVYVRRLTLGEVEQQSADAKSEDQSRLASAVARTLVDEDGVALYDRNNPEDIKRLLSLPWTLVSRLLDESNKINNLNEEGVKATEKN